MSINAFEVIYFMNCIDQWFIKNWLFAVITYDSISYIKLKMDISTAKFEIQDVLPSRDTKLKVGSAPANLGRLAILPQTTKLFVRLLFIISWVSYITVYSGWPPINGFVDCSLLRTSKWPEVVGNAQGDWSIFVLD